MHPNHTNSKREFRALIIIITILSSIVVAGGSGVTWHFYNSGNRVANAMGLVEGRLMGVESNQIALQTQMNQVHLLLQSLIANR